METRNDLDYANSQPNENELKELEEKKYKFDMFKNGYYVFTIEEYDNIQNKYETEIENLKRKLGYERLR